MESQVLLGRWAQLGILDHRERGGREETPGPGAPRERQESRAPRANKAPVELQASLGLLGRRDRPALLEVLATQGSQAQVASLALQEMLANKGSGETLGRMASREQPAPQDYQGWLETQESQDKRERKGLQGRQALRDQEENRAYLVRGAPLVHLGKLELLAKEGTQAKVESRATKVKRALVVLMV